MGNPDKAASEQASGAIVVTTEGGVLDSKATMCRYQVHLPSKWHTTPSTPDALGPPSHPSQCTDSLLLHQRHLLRDNKATQTTHTLYAVRYWMSLLSTMLCLQSFVYCVVCFSLDAVSNMATSSSQAIALEITARKIILDLGVLCITVTVGLLLFLTERKTCYTPPAKSGLAEADDTGSMFSSILVAYKLFQMIVAVDISIRLLQGLRVALMIVDLNFIHALLLFVLPVCAASIEVTLTVATFIDMQSAFRSQHQARILAIS